MVSTIYTEWKIVELEAGGYIRQSSRTTGGWLVYYSNPETWHTTQVEFIHDEEE